MLFRSGLVSPAFQVQRLTRSGLTKPPCCCIGHPVMLSFLPEFWTLLDLLRPKVMGPTGGRAGSVAAEAAGDMATAECLISETERVLENECYTRGPELNIYAVIGNHSDNFITSYMYCTYKPHPNIDLLTM